MSTKSTGNKVCYTRHSAEYKQESLKLAAQIGVPKAAKQLGLHEFQRYAWRKQFEHAQSVSEREASLASENGRLKRQLAQQAEALSILKNRPSALTSPYEKKQSAPTLVKRSDAGRLLFGDQNPVKKPGLWEAADPTVAAHYVTPFRNVI